MKRKNIIIAPCGNKSFLFRQSWMKDSTDREFDVCLLFYHENIDQPNLYGEIDFFFHLKDFKYKMLHKLLVDIKPEWLEEYEYFYFLDDDIEIDTKSINLLFSLSRSFNSSISCASLSHDSFCSWPIFRQNRNCFLRYVGQIEVMAPLFHKEALKTVLPTFIENRSSWGFDSVWSKLLGYSNNGLVIFDSIVMKHTLPVGGGELYTKIGVDPHDEWMAIIRKYNARPENHREYGRLRLLTVNNNILYRLTNSVNQGLMILMRIIRDYDITSRIKNKFSMLSKR